MGFDSAPRTTIVIRFSLVAALSASQLSEVVIDLNEALLWYLRFSVQQRHFNSSDLGFLRLLRRSLSSFRLKATRWHCIHSVVVVVGVAVRGWAGSLEVVGCEMVNQLEEGVDSIQSVRVGKLDRKMGLYWQSASR